MFIIRGEEWRVKIVDPNNLNLQRSDGSYTIGCTDDRQKTIFIADGLSEERLRLVIIHEITHAVMYSMDIYMDIYQEEVLCNVVAKYSEWILHTSYEELRQLERA